MLSQSLMYYWENRLNATTPDRYGRALAVISTARHATLSTPDVFDNGLPMPGSAFDQVESRTVEWGQPGTARTTTVEAGAVAD